MPRENSYARTRNNDLQLTERPTQGTQVFEHPVANPKPNIEGLELLRQAFSGFFDATAVAADRIEQADHVVRMHDIEQENQREKLRGKADAESGVPNAIPNDKDYNDAYEQAQGIRTGQKMTQDFHAQLATLPFGSSDLGAFQQQFFREQWGNGTGSAVHDAYALSTFHAGTAAAIDAWQTNNVKFAILKQRDAFGENIEQQVAAGKFDADQYSRALETGAKFFPEDPTKAKPWVLSKMAAAANTPAAQTNVINLLRAPDPSDKDGRSFAQQFPDAAWTIEHNLTEKWRSQVSFSGAKEYAAFDRDLSDEKVLRDPIALLGMKTKLDGIFDRNGGEQKYTELHNKINSALQPLLKDIAGYNEFVMAATGAGGKDWVGQDKINKFQWSYITNAVGGDPFTSDDPKTWAFAAGVAKQTKGISGEFKDRLNDYLSNTNDPQKQARAFEIARSMEGAGVDLAPALGDNAFREYLAAKRLVGTTGDPVAAFTVAAATSDIKKLPKDIKDADWSTLMDMAGKTKNEALVKANGLLRERIAETFDINRLGVFDAPGKVVLDGNEYDDLMGSYAALITKYHTRGVSDPAKSASEDMVQYLSREFMVAPVSDGKLKVMKRDVPDVDLNGRKVVIPGVSKNEVGEPEDTTQNFRDDIRAVARTAPGLFGDASAFAVARAQETSTTGLFNVVSPAGQPVYLAPGQKVSRIVADADPANLDGARSEDITLPADPKEIGKALDIPDYFALKPETFGDKTAYRLMYRFHFKPVPTAAERARAFEQNTGTLRADKAAAESALEGRRTITDSYRTHYGSVPKE
jgi:hypothetical protein